MTIMFDILLFTVQLGTFKGDVWLALFLLFAVIIFAWAKQKIGDVSAAVVFTIAIMMIVFYEHSELIWIVIGIYLFNTFGKEMFKGGK